MAAPPSSCQHLPPYMVFSLPQSWAGNKSGWFETCLGNQRHLLCLRVLCLVSKTYTANLNFVLLQTASTREGGTWWWIWFSRHQLLSFPSNIILLLCQQQRLYQRAKRFDLQPVIPPLTPGKIIFQIKISPILHIQVICGMPSWPNVLLPVSIIYIIQFQNPWMAFQVNSYVGLGIF